MHIVQRDFINRAFLSPAPTLLLNILAGYLFVSMFKDGRFYPEPHFKGVAKTSVGSSLVHLFKCSLRRRTQ